MKRASMPEPAWPEHPCSNSGGTAVRALFRCAARYYFMSWLICIGFTVGLIVGAAMMHVADEKAGTHAVQQWFAHHAHRAT